jgi:hypothetical protein
MADETENIVLEMLRRIDAKIAGCPSPQPRVRGCQAQQ